MSTTRSEPMENPGGISLVDNTVPSQPPTSRESTHRSPSLGRQSTLTKQLSRISVSGHRAKRKYAKWQPERLGITSDTEHSTSRESSRARGSVSAASSAGPASRQSSRQRDSALNGAGATSSETETHDLAPLRTLTTTNETSPPSGLTQAPTTTDEPKILSELDILYENQRGWFCFGIPFYSHSSLLNLDPAAWMTQDKRPSAVNITNAQVPDPSWEWAWRTWYVDMSGDVDEQGWQYAFSFSSSHWHGTHPWFHSFVRRRRWVRLRTKKSERRHRGRSEFERAHMLNEDYFTIHSSKVRSRDPSLAGLSRVESGYLSRAGTRVEEEIHEDEIGDIPSLLRVLKQTSIDRERIDALKKFIEDGGEELYYLNDKIPEIMAMFLFQASRWQLISFLTKTIYDLNQQLSDPHIEDKDKLERRRDNLARAAESGKSHITGPDIFSDTNGESATGLLDLTPVSRHDTLLSKRAQVTDEPLDVLKRTEIKGIPKKAEVGREDHIY